ncbi:MAG TPA: CvpA family protein, partial [Xanthomonadales bacterium]|nr:CvpA family protein [Xanthomonadales bacterium]
MNTADIAIAVIVSISVVIGLVRGFVVEVMSLLVWIAAVALAIAFGPQVSEWFGGSIELPSARVALGYAIVFFSVLIAGAIVVYLLRKLVQGTGLSGTDRMFGMLFGLARGAIVVVVLVLLLGFTPLPRDPWWRESRALPVFEALARSMAQWLPDGIARYVEYGLAAGAAAEAEAGAEPAP